MSLCEEINVRVRINLQESKSHVLPSRLLEPTPHTQSEGEISTSIPSSQWSERKHELYDSMNPEEQDLFDELQDEIEELRKLLGSKDKKQAAKKVKFLYKWPFSLIVIVKFGKQQHCMFSTLYYVNSAFLFCTLYLSTFMLPGFICVESMLLPHLKKL